jgi:hypothetical protein
MSSARKFSSQYRQARTAALTASKNLEVTRHAFLREAAFWLKASPKDTVTVDRDVVVQDYREFCIQTGISEKSVTAYASRFNTLMGYVLKDDAKALAFLSVAKRGEPKNYSIQAWYDDRDGLKAERDAKKATERAAEEQAKQSDDASPQSLKQAASVQLAPVSAKTVGDRVMGDIAVLQEMGTKSSTAQLVRIRKALGL